MSVFANAGQCDLVLWVVTLSRLLNARVTFHMPQAYVLALKIKNFVGDNLEHFNICAYEL